MKLHISVKVTNDDDVLLAEEYSCIEQSAELLRHSIGHSASAARFMCLRALNVAEAKELSVDDTLFGDTLAAFKLLVSRLVSMDLHEDAFGKYQATIAEATDVIRMIDPDWTTG